MLKNKTMWTINFQTFNTHLIVYFHPLHCSYMITCPIVLRHNHTGQRHMFQKEADNCTIIILWCGIFKPPGSNSTVHQSSSSCCVTRSWRNNIHSFLVRKDIPNLHGVNLLHYFQQKEREREREREIVYPISGKNNKFISFSKMVVVNVRDRNQTKILKTEVTKSSSHCQTRWVIIRQPYTCNLRFILQCKNPSFALLDPSGFT